MKKHITIKDIAKELNIHHTTVSRALHESKAVKKETRELIRKKARELGYQPNLLARGLRYKRTNVIAIVVPDVKHHFFSNFVSGFSTEANALGYSVMVFQTDEKLKIEKEIVERLSSYRVAGVIVSVSKETKNARHFSKLQKVDIPVVFFDRIPGNSKASQVLVDNRQGAYDAVNMMIRKGKRRIAFITNGSHINVFHDRLEGYRQALADSQIDFNEQYYLRSGLFMEDGFEAAKRLLNLRERPDGILAVDDEVGIGVIKCLTKEGIRVPEDIAVIGFDNDPMCIACSPELTSVEQSISKLTKESFKMLVRHMKDNTLKPEKKTIKTEIIQRESC